MELRDHAGRGDRPEILEPLRKFEDAAATVGKAWSGSNMGYQSRVYYADLHVPPPGAHFDSEWGFLGQFQGTTGDWREFRFDDVIDLIHESAGLSLDQAADLSDAAHDAWTHTRPEVVSILSAYLARGPDPLIEQMQKEAEETQDFSPIEATRALIGPIGPKMIRDTTAFSQGFMAAPHQAVQGRVIAIRSRFMACASLARVAERAASHMERIEAATAHVKGSVSADRVFIGHGQSDLWRELKDFVADDLGLPWDEFNRVPVAGVTTIDRLSEMLDNAGVAFIVLTAEDETVDGRDLARQNVVHEVGLFQSRLGFKRAIVLLEDGCDEFSNISGLSQVRFPKGNIKAAFHDVRKVLQREGFVP